MSASFDLRLPAAARVLPLSGELQVPPDKSISHRVLILAALAQGTSYLANVLAADDVRSTLKALRQLGLKVRVTAESPATGAFDLEIQGAAGANNLRSAKKPLDLGNSGTSMRLLAGLLCGCNVRATLLGDVSLMRRPMRRIVEPLRAMGADIRCADNGCAPLEIYPVDKPLRAMDYRLPVASAQVKSAILLAALAANGDTTVEENAEGLSRNHTEILLQQQGRIHLSQRRADGHLWQRATVTGGGAPLQPLDVRVPADPSSAAFAVLAAALRPGSQLRLPAVGVNPTRTGFLAKMRQCGLRIDRPNEWLENGEMVADLQVQAAPLGVCEVAPAEVPALIDEIPALAVAGHFSARGLQVSGAAELRHKESDRLGVLLQLLRRVGDTQTQLAESKDGAGFSVKAGAETPMLAGGEMDSGGDHRIAMAFAVASPLAADLHIRNCRCIGTSFPGFVAGMRHIGVDIQRLEPTT